MLVLKIKCRKSADVRQFGVEISSDNGLCKKEVSWKPFTDGIQQADEHGPLAAQIEVLKGMRSHEDGKYDNEVVEFCFEGIEDLYAAEQLGFRIPRRAMSLKDLFIEIASSTFYPRAKAKGT